MTDRTPGNRRRCPWPAVAAAGVLALSTVPALLAAGGGDVVDTVDVEVGGRDTVLGTIRPAEERETFLLDLPRGAKIKATVKAQGPGAPASVVDVSDPDGVVLGVSVGAKASKTPQIVTATSGVHRLRVCGDGVLDGDYKLVVKAKMPKSASGASAADVAPGGEATFSFGAGGGTTATVTVTAAKRSSFIPTILEITGPQDLSIPVEPPGDPGKRHVVRGVRLPEPGDYTVRFRNDGEAPGGWTAKAKLKTPKAAKSSIEITDDVLGGEYAGGQAVYARVIDSDGGVVAPEGDDLDDLDLLGVSVEVPAGAVTEPTLFTIAEADTYFVDDDLPEGGATFELGPSGLEFSENVTVTVPFDPQAYDNPGDEVQIAIRDSDTGEIVVVTGEVDVVAGTVSFQTPGFSGFQPVSPRPRPVRGGYVELEIGGRIDDRFGGAFMLGMNALVGQDGPRTGNGVTRAVDRRTVAFGPDDQGTFVLDVDRDQRMQNGIVLADDDVTLRFPTRDVVYRRGRTPDALVRSEAQVDESIVSVLLRRVKGKTTQGALRGEWHAVVYEYSGERGTAGPIQITTAGQRFELDVRPGGAAIPSDADLRTTTVEYPGGSPETRRVRKAPRAGTLTPSGAFARLAMDLGAADGPAFIDLHPVARGDMLIGVTGDSSGPTGNPSSAMARLVLLVRAGVKGDESALSGRSQLVALDAAFEDVPFAQIPVPALEVLRLDVEHDGKGKLRARGVSLVSRHGSTGASTLTSQPLDISGTYRVDKDLLYRESAPLGPGAVLRRRGLYVATFFDAERIALGFGLVSRPVDE